MIHLHFTAVDLSRVRFAVSPLLEAVASLRTLATARRGGHLHRGWVDRMPGRAGRPARARPGAAHRHWCDPAATSRTSWCRRRGAGSSSFGEALAQVAAADPEIVARELAHLATHRVAQQGPGRARRRALLQALVDRPDAGIGPVTEALEAYHRVAIAPDWQRIQALLRDDIAYRLQALADGGVDQMMRDLHPSVGFAEETLNIVKYYEGHADLGGRGLLLVPCAFAWPDVVVRTAQPSVPMVTYSPRGLGRLWEQHPAQAESGAVRRARTHPCRSPEPARPADVDDAGSHPAGVVGPHPQRASPGAAGRRSADLAA